MPIFCVPWHQYASIGNTPPTPQEVSALIARASGSRFYLLAKVTWDALSQWEKRRMSNVISYRLREFYRYVRKIGPSMFLWVKSVAWVLRIDAFYCGCAICIYVYICMYIYIYISVCKCVMSDIMLICVMCNKSHPDWINDKNNCYYVICD